MEKKYFVGILIACVVFSLSSATIARASKLEYDESLVLGSNIDFLLTVSSSVLALCLFVVSVMAYAYSRRGRMLFITAAFFLLAVKGVLVSVSDAYSQGILSGQAMAWIAPFGATAVHLSRLIDFGVLLILFFGMIKK